jgi:hypothetical protein
MRLFRLRPVISLSLKGFTCFLVAEDVICGLAALL